MSLYSLIKNHKIKKPPTCTAVIAAAGKSLRCEGEDKLYYNINGKPVLAYTLEAFQNCTFINDIIVVAGDDCFERISDICIKYKLDKVSLTIKGGQKRSESVMNGIYAVTKKARLIAVHDGARPCIDTDIIDRTVLKAAACNAAAPAVAIASTVKKAEDGVISETVSREGLFEIQTPQVFRAEVVKAAMSNAVRKSIDVTDECMAVERIGVPVHIVEGSRRNIKITDAADLKIAETFLLSSNPCKESR